MKALYDVSQVISSTIELDNVLEVLVSSLVNLTKSKVASVMLLGEDDLLRVVAIKNYNENSKLITGKTVLKIGEGIAGKVVKSGKPIFIDDMAKDNLFIKSGETEQYKLKGLLCIPLKIKGESIGCFNIHDKIDGKKYDDEDISLITNFSLQAGIAIENARLYEQIKKKAITDELTQLYNRHYFNDAFDQEILRSIRMGHQCSVLIMDIDFFKNYNDRNGHIEGDKLLHTFAGIIKDSLRKIDIIGRFGGEEFVALLPETDNENALLAAERIRKAIEETKFIGNEKQPFGKVTVSIGVTTLDCVKDKEINAHELLQRADIALYLAKEKGRNRVMNDPRIIGKF